MALLFPDDSLKKIKDEVEGAIAMLVDMSLSPDAQSSPPPLRASSMSLFLPITVPVMLMLLN